MKLKTVEHDGKQYAEIQDGKPLYIGDGDREIAFDAMQSVNKIRELNAEAKGHREAKEAAEVKLRMFDGIESPDDARQALEFKKNAKDGDFIAASKAEEAKAALKRTLDEQYGTTIKQNNARIKELEGQIVDITGKFDNEVVGNAFASSKYIREKIASPLGMIRATFGNQFKVEDGRLKAFHSDGSPIVTQTGDPADFDEAIARIVSAYPDKDLILKGSGSQGSGAKPSYGVANGVKTMTKAALDAMSPMEQANLMTSKDRPTIVD